MTRKIWAFKYVVILLVLLSLFIIACGGSSGEDEGKQPVSAFVQTGDKDQNETSTSDEAQAATGMQDSEQDSEQDNTENPPPGSESGG